MKLAQARIDPDSLRGRLVVAINSLIQEARSDPHYMRREAALQRLTADQLLAAIITERVLEIIHKEV